MSLHTSVPCTKYPAKPTRVTEDYLLVMCGTALNTAQPTTVEGFPGATCSLRHPMGFLFTVTPRWVRSKLHFGLCFLVRDRSTERLINLDNVSLLFAVEPHFNSGHTAAEPAPRQNYVSLGFVGGRDQPWMSPFVISKGAEFSPEHTCGHSERTWKETQITEPGMKPISASSHLISSFHTTKTILRPEGGADSD